MSVCQCACLPRPPLPSIHSSDQGGSGAEFVAVAVADRSSPGLAVFPFGCFQFRLERSPDLIPPDINLALGSCRDLFFQGPGAGGAPDGGSGTTRNSTSGRPPWLPGPPLAVLRALRLVRALISLHLCPKMSPVIRVGQCYSTRTGKAGLATRHDTNAHRLAGH